MTLTQFFWLCIAIVLIVGGGYILHRWLIFFEERGYIYYRTMPRGSGNVLMEIDRLTRPSVEHIEKALDTEVESQQNDGE